MAETKKKPTISSTEKYEEAKAAAQQGQSTLKGNATGLRIGAIVLWVLAFVFEILAVLLIFGKLNWSFLPMIWLLVILIVLDLACVIIGSRLWVKANHIKPASEKNKTLFWIWNNLGVIVACFAFIPMIIIMLTNKNLDKKTKVVATIVAIIALLIGGAASYDYNPVSTEQLESAKTELSGTVVWWAPFGKVYHTYVVVENNEIVECCPHLNRSESLTPGTVDEAIAAGRTRLCSYCASHDEITGVVTDEATGTAEAEDNAA